MRRDSQAQASRPSGSAATTTARTIPLAAAALLLAAAAAGATGAAPARAGDLADVQARGTLVMLTYPVQGTHFSSVDLEAMRSSGLKLPELRQPEQFRGIDVELMNGFARSLGVKLEIHAVADGYGALLPALNHRDGDLVASELTITPQRQELASFSSPYARNWIAVVVRKKSEIASPADLAGKRASLLSGSSHVEFLRSVVPNARIQLTQFDLEDLDAVEGGQAEFTLMDTPAPPGAKVDSLHPGLLVAFRLREIADGIAVRHGSDLLPPLDAYLAALKTSGELARILERNGFPSAAAPAAPRP
jgi:ABC-type amino acid transport substrate-binding protein